MRPRLIALFLTTVFSSGGWAAADQAGVAQLLVEHTHPLTAWEPELTGPGADLLVDATASAQFVLAGEWHGERTTPQLAVAVFRLMKRAHAFRFVALEEDALAVEAAASPGVRGDLNRITELLRVTPSLVGFSSDDDVKLLADLTALTNGPEEIWGLNQANSAIPYLAELEGIAPNADVRAEIAALLNDARRMDVKRSWFTQFFYENPGIVERLRKLQSRFGAQPGSRADFLLTTLVFSAWTFEGYHRLIQGDKSANYPLYAPRERLMKQRFLERYRIASTRVVQPKVFVKAGSAHAITGLFVGSGISTLGNFIHELAVVQNTQAFSIDIQSIGGESMPEPQGWLKPLLRGGSDPSPYVVDLRSLRPFAAAILDQVAAGDRATLHAEIFGFDALLVHPKGVAASWTRLGSQPPVPKT